MIKVLLSLFLFFPVFGVSVLADYGPKFNEFKSLAEQGDADAQYRLGVMYFQGFGFFEESYEYWVPNNGLVPAGVEWCQDTSVVSAAVEWSPATGGTIRYVTGAGSPISPGTFRDYIRAFLWWDIAASQGHEKAATWCMNIKKLMTPADVSKAKELIRDCVKRKYKDC